MRLKINDKLYSVSDGEAGRTLLWFLRDDLGLVGTRFGCGVGICGACTVLVNGRPTRSCITSLANVADGSPIRTVENLSRDDSLHPVQQAFIEEQVPQCGWCMSGQMMSAVSLLEENANPTDQEIQAAMTKNYCRCGCYQRIRSAVRRASDLIS